MKDTHMFMKWMFFILQCPKSFRAQQMGLVGTQQQIAANVGVK